GGGILAAAAVRELEEETGFSAASVRPIGTFLTSPGFADERMHVFAASGLRPVERRLQPGERIEVLHETVDGVAQAIADGRIRDGKSIAAFTLWKAASA
ncbi:MAG: NUDIX hydrolase, partial [Planctomycetota bacterium]